MFPTAANRCSTVVDYLAHGKELRFVRGRLPPEMWEARGYQHRILVPIRLGQDVS